ncbi:MAG: hypothetical protein ACRDI2_17420 [Chloroflexota bacterium]
MPAASDLQRLRCPGGVPQDAPGCPEWGQGRARTHGVRGLTTQTPPSRRARRQDAWLWEGDGLPRGGPAATGAHRRPARRHPAGRDRRRAPRRFTLAFLPGAPPRFLADASRADREGVLALIVFRRHDDGRVTVADFPEEADVCADVVASLEPAVARLERGRRSRRAANGEAVSVPVGPSPWPPVCARGTAEMAAKVGNRLAADLGATAPFTPAVTPSSTSRPR